MLEDIIENAENDILANGFPLIESKQRGYYSWYIAFIPISKDGVKLLDEVNIRFRISNHDANGADSDIYHAKEVFVKSFTINDKAFTSGVKGVIEIKRICNDLYEGNTRSLLSYKSDSDLEYY